MESHKKYIVKNNPELYCISDDFDYTVNDNCRMIGLDRDEVPESAFLITSREFKEDDHFAVGTDNDGEFMLYLIPDDIFTKCFEEEV